ncbi:MAG TPA: hypothetical protein VJH20_03660 [Candidatus Nanoarchaeia archaeon]|nr:hypothetical protein [Candidatus Nanoarchaeia archaeon]
MIRPLIYNSGLSLEEAESRYREVREEFDRVRSCYSGLPRLLMINIRKEDQQSLTDCFGVLLPLGMESSVQSQAKQTQSIEDTLQYQIGLLTHRIMDYLANFKNTGVTRLHSSFDL